MATVNIFTPEEIKKQFESLPSDIQKVIYSAEMTAAIKAVGEKNRLHVDQLGTLEGEVSFVMLGLTDPKDFVRVLKERLPAEESVARTVASDVDQMLFSRIRESLKKMHSNEKLVSSEVKPAASFASQASSQKPSTPPRAQSSTPQTPSAAAQKPISSASQPAPATPVAPKMSTSSAPANLPTEPQVEFMPRSAASAEEKKVPEGPRDPFAAPSVTKEQKVDVGIPQQKPSGYKTDPYRELPE